MNLHALFTLAGVGDFTYEQLDCRVGTPSGTRRSPKKLLPPTGCTKGRSRMVLPNNLKLVDGAVMAIR